MEKGTVVAKTRDEIRGEIFKGEHKKLARKPFTLNGTKLEVRQPTIKQLGDLANQTSDKPAVVRYLIAHTYVPGTDERVFDDADAEALSEFPAGPWLGEFNEAFSALTAFDTKAAEKNSAETE